MTRDDSAVPQDVAAHRWVDNEAALKELGRGLDEAKSHALDTESNSGFAYRERLCLLQFNVAGVLWMVDLLALPETESSLDPIRRSLEAADRRTLLHGGEFDVGCLKRDYAMPLAGVWDTQQAASFLGWPKTGYGSVVEEVCDVQLDKGYAHYDWGRRPVATEALRYAVDDVLYLPQVAAHLESEIEEADLVDEMEIANRAVMSATWTGRGGAESIWQLKGVRRLPPEALPRLVALWEWREATAKVEDRPPGRVLNTQLMLALARRGPRRQRELRSAGVRGRLLAYAGDLLEALSRARDKPPRVPDPPRGERPTPGESNRLKRLKEWRRAESARRGVPQHVVLPPTAMLHLARHGGDRLESIPQLGEKRARLYGSRLSELSR